MRDLVFWGVNVPPKTPVPVRLSDDSETDFVHVTNVALATGEHHGLHTVVVKTGKEAFTLGTLALGKVMQFNVDTILSDDAVFAHNGSGEVSITGYRAIADSSDLGGPMWDDVPSDLEEEDEEVEEDSDEDEAPQGVPIDARDARVKVKAVLRRGDHPYLYLLLLGDTVWRRRFGVEHRCLDGAVAMSAMAPTVPLF